jgi:hypothetical protein
MERLFDPVVYLTLLRSYHAFCTVLDLIYGFSQRTTRRALLVIQPQEYVFFRGYTTPHLSSTVIKTGPCIPEIDWKYNVETNLISDGAATVATSLPWLSAAIRYNGLNLYPLDSFINDVKYSSEKGVPSPAIIVGAWSIRTGIVLDNQVDLELFVITEEGEQRTVSPWSLDPLSNTLLLEAELDGPLAATVSSTVAAVSSAVNHEPLYNPAYEDVD